MHHERTVRLLIWLTANPFRVLNTSLHSQKERKYKSPVFLVLQLLQDLLAAPAQGLPGRRLTEFSNGLALIVQPKP